VLGGGAGARPDWSRPVRAVTPLVTRNAATATTIVATISCFCLRGIQLCGGGVSGKEISCGVTARRLRPRSPGPHTAATRRKPEPFTRSLAGVARSARAGSRSGPDRSRSDCSRRAWASSARCVRLPRSPARRPRCSTGTRPARRCAACGRAPGASARAQPSRAARATPSAPRPHRRTRASRALQLRRLLRAPAGGSGRVPPAGTAVWAIPAPGGGRGARDERGAPRSGSGRAGEEGRTRPSPTTVAPSCGRGAGPGERSSPSPGRERTQAPGHCRPSTPRGGASAVCARRGAAGGRVVEAAFRSEGGAEDNPPRRRTADRRTRGERFDRGPVRGVPTIYLRLPVFAPIRVV
jgi:hypothetical protein